MATLPTVFNGGITDMQITYTLDEAFEFQRMWDREPTNFNRTLKWVRADTKAPVTIGAASAQCE